MAISTLVGCASVGGAGAYCAMWSQVPDDKPTE